MVTQDLGTTVDSAQRKDPQAENKHLKADIRSIWRLVESVTYVEGHADLLGCALLRGQRMGRGLGSRQHPPKGLISLPPAFLALLSGSLGVGIPLQIPRPTLLLGHLSCVLYYAKHGEESSRALVLGVGSPVHRPSHVLVNVELFKRTGVRVGAFIYNTANCGAK